MTQYTDKTLDSIDYEAIRNRINQDNHFLQSSRMHVKEIRNGYAVVDMSIDEQIQNIYGLVHGGALFALADTAAGAASLSHGTKTVTQCADIHFLRPGISGKLHAIAFEISCTHTTALYDVKIYDENDKLLCSANITMFFLYDRKK